MKTLFKKVMWTGRATVFTVGLAVTLALIVGVATTALAAVPGDPFKLGQRNGINALTSLVGSVNGAMLSIENNFSEIKGASALSLKVAQGNPPLAVNPEAGTATDLSADELDGKDSSSFLASDGKAADSDKLDGKDSTGFLTSTGKAADSDKLDGKDSTAFANGTNGKANDADKLDGKDSKDFVPTKTYLVEGLSNSPGGGATTFTTANCKPGDRILSGGPQNVTSGEEEVLDDFPFVSSFDPSQQSWNVKYRDPGAPGDIITLALCADVP